MMPDEKQNLVDLLTRKKVFYLTTRHLIKMFLANQVKETYVTIPELCIPEDAVVSEMWIDYPRAALALMLCHQSFNRVPEGEAAPEITVHWQVVELARSEAKEKP